MTEISNDDLRIINYFKKRPKLTKPQIKRTLKRWTRVHRAWENKTKLYRVVKFSNKQKIHTKL